MRPVGAVGGIGFLQLCGNAPGLGIYLVVGQLPDMVFYFAVRQLCPAVALGPQALLQLPRLGRFMPYRRNLPVPAGNGVLYVVLRIGKTAALPSLNVNVTLFDRGQGRLAICAACSW